MHRGFTLVELMAVVAIIGVLAALGFVGYRRWVRNAYVAEGTNMIGAIKEAEEHWFSQTHRYLDVSAGLGVGNLYPAPTPGKTVTPWGAPCTSCKTDWRRLDVSATEPVWFGYAVVADTELCDPACKGVNVSTTKGKIDFTALNRGAVTKPWFVAEAMADTDGNGVFCTIVGHSFGTDLIVDNEGE